MNIKKITTGGIMVALASVLSMISIIKLPQGGSVTMASMAPIIIFSLISDFKSSIIVAFVHSLIQMILGSVAPPAQDFLSYTLVIMLDYVIAFTVLGCAGIIGSGIKNSSAKALVGTLVVTFARFICHLLSGILIWKVYAPEGQSPFYYSLIYNGSYMLLEMIITSVAVVLITKYIKKA